MTWFLAYNRSEATITVDTSGRQVPAQEFTYADNADPVAVVHLVEKRLIDVTRELDENDPRWDYEARLAYAVVVYRNGGDWSPPPPPPPLLSVEGNNAAIYALLLSRGAAGGIAPLDGSARVPDVNLPARLQDAALNTKIDSLIDTAVSDLVAGAPGALDTLYELATALVDADETLTVVLDALAQRIQVGEKGAALGVATLDATTRLVPGQVPQYLEEADLAAFFLPRAEPVVSIRFGDGGALPAAAVAYRGQTRMLFGSAGVADRLVICRKNAADAYEWADLP